MYCLKKIWWHRSKIWTYKSRTPMIVAWSKKLYKICDINMPLWLIDVIIPLMLDWIYSCRLISCLRDLRQFSRNHYSSDLMILRWSNWGARNRNGGLLTFSHFNSSIVAKPDVWGGGSFWIRPQPSCPILLQCHSSGYLLANISHFLKLLCNICSFEATLCVIQVWSDVTLGASRSIVVRLMAPSVVRPRVLASCCFPQFTVSMGFISLEPISLWL